MGKEERETNLAVEEICHLSQNFTLAVQCKAIVTEANFMYKNNSSFQQINLCWLTELHASRVRCWVPRVILQASTVKADYTLHRPAEVFLCKPTGIAYIRNVVQRVCDKPGGACKKSYVENWIHIPVYWCLFLL